jgi:hypothetical protein
MCRNYLYSNCLCRAHEYYEASWHRRCKWRCYELQRPNTTTKSQKRGFSSARSEGR